MGKKKPVLSKAVGANRVYCTDFNYCRNFSLTVSAPDEQF